MAAISTRNPDLYHTTSATRIGGWFHMRLAAAGKILFIYERSHERGVYKQTWIHLIQRQLRDAQHVCKQKSIPNVNILWWSRKYNRDASLIVWKIPLFMSRNNIQFYFETSESDLRAVQTVLFNLYLWYFSWKYIEKT